MKDIIAIIFVLCLRSESPSGMCAKLHTVAASNNCPPHRDHSITAFSRHVHIGAILRAHPVRGELLISAPSRPRGCNTVILEKKCVTSQPNKDLETAKTEIQP